MAVAEESRPSGGTDDRRERPEWIWIALLVVLFALTAVVYVVLGRKQPAPLFSPDEFLYGHLAESLAAGNGFSWRGETFGLRPSLLVRLLAPLWDGASLDDAYRQSKLVGGIALSAVVFPTWFLARGFLGPRLAFVPTVLCVLGVWMTVASGILTENLAFPLGTAALACLVAYLPAARLRWGLGTLAFAAVATFARAQLAVLFPIILLSVVVSAWLGVTSLRDGLERHRLVGGITAVVSVAGLIAALASPASVLGGYEIVGSTTPGLGDLLGALKDQAIAIVLTSAVLPLAIVAAGSARRDVWKDPLLAPLLIATWATVGGFVLLSAYFIALAPGVAWSIERYVMYPVPLLLIAMTVLVARRRVELRAFAIASVVAAVLVAISAGARSALEERGLYALNLRVGDLLGSGTALSLVVAAALVLGAAAALLAVGRKRSAGVAVLLIAGLLGAVALVQAQAGWSWQIDTARAEVAGWRGAYRGPLGWLDARKPGPLARLITTSNTPRFQLTDYFNGVIRAIYVPDRPIGGPSLNGRTCPWTLGDDGKIGFGSKCGPAPRRLLLDDDFGKLTIYGQRVRFQEPYLGRVADIPARPRARALIYVPCSPPVQALDLRGIAKVRPARRFCPQARLSGQLFLDRPATFALTWKGGTTDNQIQIGPKLYDIPAGRPTTVRLPVPAGNNPFQLDLPWTDPPPASPLLVSARLIDRRGSTELLY